jgi:hypothetical protein
MLEEVMRTLLIGYDLDTPGQDYSDLTDAIKECTAWWHCLDSTWIVRAEDTVVQLRNRLRSHVDGNDE